MFEAARPDLTAAVQPAHPFTPLLIDPHGLWSETLDVLPAFDGHVRWETSQTQSQPKTDGLSIRLTNTLADYQSGAEHQKGSVTVLVDSEVPIGLHGCGAILTCSRDTLSAAVAAMAGAIFAVALANHVAHFGWGDVLEVISRDVLMVAVSMPGIDSATIASSAVRTLGYFQGVSRIEPEAVMLGAIASAENPPSLGDMSKLSSSIRAISGLSCHQIVACHLSKQRKAAAFLLATFPIPALPGQPVRARRRWPR